MYKMLSLVLFFGISQGAFASQAKKLPVKKTTLQRKVEKKDLAQLDELKKAFKVEYKKNSQLARLKMKTMALSNKAVPLLVEVMKGKEYPDKNRWVATFMLGKIMGKKASKYIAQYIVHPHWMLRLASLKTLLHLDGREFGRMYSHALQDKSMIVRMQALENIRALKLKELAPQVWRMLFNKANYNGMEGKLKRTAVIRKIIRVIGDLGHQKATEDLKKLASKRQYQDILPDLDYSLNKLTGKSSPKTLEGKRIFWKEARVNLKSLN